MDPLTLVRAGQLACLRLLTALPLSNKAEFVTKMYAGIERKFNCRSSVVRLITVRSNPSLALRFNKSTVIKRLSCQS